MTTVPPQSTTSTTTTRTENVTGNNKTETNCHSTTLATTVVTHHNRQVNTPNSRQRSRSPIHEPANTNPTALRQTESEETCVTFRPESNTENENVDDEMDVIPQSPQPTRRRRFKIFPRLYSQTQYPSQGRVLQENSDCELWWWLNAHRSEWCSEWVTVAVSEMFEQPVPLRNKFLFIL